MSIATLIIGTSGTGKSTSLRNLDPANTAVVQVIRKPLPFRAKGWNYFDREKCLTGNMFVTDQWAEILAIARKTRRKVIIIDDFQYMLANEFMRRSDEKGYDKFSDIGRHAWEVISELSRLPDDVRVYILSHSDERDDGSVKMKTIGKMLDDKITPEGMFTIVLRTVVTDGTYQFSTANNGHDVVKSPMGLFEDSRIDNDLEAVDAAICDYYAIETAAAAAPQKKSAQHKEAA
jgi:hypothetical protein